jgi:hypothetical protein
MSEALERVIAEQQREIDTIRKYRAIDAERWAKHNTGIESLVEAAFGLINNPTSHDALMTLKLALAYQGWCLTCEESPCECGGQYD